MFKAIAAVSLLLILGACTTTSQPIQTQTQFAYYEIPSVLLNCGEKKVSQPDPNTLTDVEVSAYITKIQNLLDECQSDANTVRKLEADLKLKVSQLNR